jgi:hypothetical protein
VIPRHHPPGYPAGRNQLLLRALPPSELEAGSLDCLVFGDVLGHLADPEAALELT